MWSWWSSNEHEFRLYETSGLTRLWKADWRVGSERVEDAVDIEEEAEEEGIKLDELDANRAGIFRRLVTGTGRQERKRWQRWRTHGAIHRRCSLLPAVVVSLPSPPPTRSTSRYPAPPSQTRLPTRTADCSKIVELPLPSLHRVHQRHHDLVRLPRRTSQLLVLQLLGLPRAPSGGSGQTVVLG